MCEGFISRGFGGRRRRHDERLPPGQYLVDGFPVLSAGPTPHTPLAEWDFSIVGEVDELGEVSPYLTDVLEEVGPPPGERPLLLVCGPAPLVEAVATALAHLGHGPSRVKTERFGDTGG